MKFVLPDNGQTIITIARKIGYRPMGQEDNGEYNIVRDLSGQGYPRFHIYIKKNKETGDLLFDLHLDQKFPSYGNNHRHSGEYDSEVVEEEAKRVKNIFLDGVKEQTEGRVFKF